MDVQLCGDARLSNFGVFASPEREPLFDLNDFDETLPGPFEHDVKRLAASFAIAARNNRVRPSRRTEGDVQGRSGVPDDDGRVRAPGRAGHLVRQDVRS
ncbi:MAG TPA: DUF2252 family protein [Microlunatus sp.]